MTPIRKESKFGKHTFGVTITEKPHEVEFVPFCVPFIDPKDMEAMKAYQDFMLPILEKYDSDPRPTVMFNSFSGETFKVWGNANKSIGLLTKNNEGN